MLRYPDVSCTDVFQFCLVAELIFLIGCDVYFVLRIGKCAEMLQTNC